MAQKNEGKNDKLPDLPPSDNKWWGESEKYTTDLRKQGRQEHTHNFIHRSGREVVCTVCNVGFYISAEFSVRNGKLLYRGKKLEALGMRPSK